MLQKQKLKCLSCFTGIFSLSIETLSLALHASNTLVTLQHPKLLKPSSITSVIKPAP